MKQVKIKLKKGRKFYSEKFCLCLKARSAQEGKKGVMRVVPHRAMLKRYQPPANAKARNNKYSCF